MPWRSPRKHAVRVARAGTSGALLLLLCACASSREASRSRQWQPIFNGRTLAGWTPKIVGEAAGADARRTFRVERGAIRVSYAGYNRFENRFGHLFYDQPLRYFRLRFRYRFLDGGLSDAPNWARSNSGIMFLAQPPAEMSRDQWFPISIEFQLLGRIDAAARPTGAVCTPGTTIRIAGEQVKEHCTAPRGRTIANGHWVRVGLDVLPSGEIVHRIDGREVIRYTQPRLDADDPLVRDNPSVSAGPLDIREGYLALQSEGHPIEFADLELQRLM